MEGVYLDVAGPAVLDHFVQDHAHRDRLLASLDHPWAREAVRRLVLRDGHGRHLSYLELHAIPALHLDREIWMGGIARLVTAEGFRGQGNAGTLLRLTMDLLEHEGVAGALLWTKIGSPFFERSGFRAIGTWAVDAALEALPPRTRGSLEIRPLEEDDRLAVGSIHRRAGSGEPLWLLRDARRWDFLFSRGTSALAGGGVLGRVASTGRRIVGYAIYKIDGERLDLLEFGQEGRDPHFLIALLAHLREEAAARGCARFTSPWPPGAWGSLFEPLFRPVEEARPLMVASLGNHLDIETLVEGMQGYWETDRI